ncbi:hypothetical protein MASR2M48_25160 [Spirochaetota bacterium]
MKHAEFRLGETILGDVAKTGKNIFAPDVASDSRFVKNGDDDFLRLSSFMAVPLMVEDKIIGVQAVAKTMPGEQFGEADFDGLTASSPTLGHYLSAVFSRSWRLMSGAA